MKHLAAYCLLILGGNADPSEDDVVQLLKKSGVEADAADLKVMMKKLKDDGKTVQELMKEGRE